MFDTMWSGSLWEAMSLRQDDPQTLLFPAHIHIQIYMYLLPKGKITFSFWRKRGAFDYGRRIREIITSKVFIVALSVLDLAAAPGASSSSTARCPPPLATRTGAGNIQQGGGGTEGELRGRERTR